MSGGADNLNGDLWSYITGADMPKMAVENARDREGLEVYSLAPVLHRQLAIVMRPDKILSRGLAEVVRLLAWRHKKPR